MGTYQLDRAASCLVVRAVGGLVGVALVSERRGFPLNSVGVRVRGGWG